MQRFALSILFLLLSVSFIQAADVTLAWDASEGTVDGYGLFDRNFQKQYDYKTPSWIGTTITGIVTVPSDRQSAFIVRAFVWGPYDLQGNRIKEWSDDSNEAIYTPSTVKPLPPKNIVIRILLAIANFFGHLFG